MVEIPKTVALFLPCLADQFYPTIGRSATVVLRAAGLKVVYPRGQTCCGQWAVNLGHFQAARSLARHFISLFDRFDAVVAPSGSCVMTVKNHYPEILENNPALRRRAESLKERTFELTDFLVNRVQKIELGARLEITATLHDSCHPLRGLGLKEEPRRLLRAIDGLTLIEMDEPEVCCGFGGAFMAKYARLSRTMAGEKVDQALKTGAEVLVMTEPGCLLNVDSVIKARDLKIKARHVVDVLAEGMGEGHARF
jgi:L-lactate dehydrogenase complex protein LldE